MKLGSEIGGSIFNTQMGLKKGNFWSKAKWSLPVGVISAILLFTFWVPAGLKSDMYMYAVASVQSRVPLLTMRQRVSGLWVPSINVRDWIEADEVKMAALKQNLIVLGGGSVFSFAGTLFLFLWFDRRRTKKLLADVCLDGVALETPKAVYKKLKKEGPADLKLGEYFIVPQALQNLHFLWYGGTRSGKTNAMNQAVEMTIDQGKNIVFDVEGGYIGRFFKSERDYIWNCADKRCLKWSVWSDLRNKHYIDSFCASLIPPSIDKNLTFWLSAAQAVSRGAMHWLDQAGARTNAAIWEFFTLPDEAIMQRLLSVPEGKAGARMLGKVGSNQFSGVMATLMEFALCFELMADIDGDFSILDWLKDENRKGAIFISSNEHLKEVLKPANSLFLDFMLKSCLDPDVLSENEDRVLSVYMDELNSLNRMRSLPAVVQRIAKRGGRIHAGVQSKAGTDAVYGLESSNDIFNNLNHTICFANADPVAQKYAQERLGQGRFEIKRPNVGAGRTDSRDGFTITTSTQDKYAVMAGTIGKFKQGQAAVKIAGQNPYIYRFPLKKYPVVSPAFVLRDGMELKSYNTKMDVIKAKTGELCTALNIPSWWDGGVTAAEAGDILELPSKYWDVNPNAPGDGLF